MNKPGLIVDYFQYESNSNNRFLTTTKPFYLCFSFLGLLCGLFKTESKNFKSTPLNLLQSINSILLWLPLALLTLSAQKCENSNTKSGEKQHDFFKETRIYSISHDTITVTITVQRKNTFETFCRVQEIVPQEFELVLVEETADASFSRDGDALKWIYMNYPTHKSPIPLTYKLRIPKGNTLNQLVISGDIGYLYENYRNKEPFESSVIPLK